MTISHWQADGTQAQRDVDFLVIGGGIVGCAAAYFAGQAGHDVVIAERHNLAMGASGRNAGFMITGLDTHYHKAIVRYGADVAYEMWELSQQTIAFWKQMIAQSSVHVPLDESGSLLLAETAQEAQDIALAAKALDAAGIEIIYHKQDPLGRGYHAAIEQPHDAAVQPFKLAHAVLEQSGAALVPDCEVYKIEQESPDVVTVYSKQYIFKAQHVLLCTNAYSPLIDPYFVGKVIPTRAQALITDPLPQPVMQSCGYSNYGYMYYRMTFDGRFLIGGGRDQHMAQENDTTEDRINPAVQAQLDRYIRKYFPEIDVPVARRWAGIMGFSVDGLPLVGTLPHKKRVGFAVGFTGHGLAMGAITAQRAVEHLLNGTHAGAVDARRLDSQLANL